MEKIKQMSLTLSVQRTIMKWTLVWASVFITTTAVFLAIFFYIDANNRVQHERDRLKYHDDTRNLEKIMGKNEKYLRVTTFYTEIHVTFGQKYVPKYIGKPEQGLHTKEEALLNREWERLSRILGFPYMILPAKAVVESALKKNAQTFRTYKLTDGTEVMEPLETGLYQHREIAVGQAFIFFNRMPTYLQKECFFYYNSPEDLKDPINATRIEAVLTWGSMIKYKRDLIWVWFAIHHGEGKSWPLYRYDIEPPKEYVFNKGRPDEDAKNPFSYPFLVYKHFIKFNQFDTQVGISRAWIDRYKETCSKIEWSYIELQKTVQKYNRKRQQQTEKAKEADLEEEERFKEIDKLALKLENKGRELNGLIKKGKFTNVKEVYLFMESFTKETMRDFVSKETQRNRKVAIGALLCIIVIVLIFALAGFIWMILSIIKKMRQRYIYA
jgi:hypothetical protein